MKIARYDRAVKLGCSDLCGIGKDNRASSQLLARRAADVISKSCFTVMNGDRHDELAALNLA